MSSAIITMMGLYNYDNTLFDGLTLPTGINKQTAVDEILIRCGEFEVLYPDPNFMKSMITHWGTKHFRTFEKWIDVLNLEFDPLYNFDRFEEYTDEKVAQGNVKANSNQKNTISNSSVDNGSISSFDKNTTNNIDNKSDIINESSSSTDSGNSSSQTSTDSKSDETDTRNVSAYDAATYQPREQEIKGVTSSQTGNGTAQNVNESESEKTTNSNSTGVQTGESNTESSVINNSVNNSQSDESSNTESNTESNNVEQNKHTAHLYGNIGVTTSTELLEDYIRVERFNIYEQIADIFVDEFCLMIY